LTGIADVVEETAGEVYPVEYKKGHRGDWKNDQLQLCAQAMCLEEMLNLATPIARGFVYYVGTGRRQEVSFDATLRSYTIHTITAVHTLFETRQRPDAQAGVRCQGCSLYSVCLPKEVEKLRGLRVRKDKKRIKPIRTDDEKEYKWETPPPS
jgi:CRISPR-associated exonuclease Cas4